VSMMIFGTCNAFDRGVEGSGISLRWNILLMQASNPNSQCACVPRGCETL
jgi:hypothetical protein